MADPSGVLIADDDTELRELVAEYLSGHGFHVLQATNGLEALLCVKRERPKAVLLDDDHEVNELLGEVLSLRGVETFSVTNAMDALRLLGHGAPDAIFLDIEMPGLSGLDALPAIRALAPDAKVVMVSGIHDEAVA